MRSVRCFKRCFEELTFLSKAWYFLWSWQYFFVMIITGLKWEGQVIHFTRTPCQSFDFYGQSHPPMTCSSRGWGPPSPRTLRASRYSGCSLESFNGLLSGAGLKNLHYPAYSFWKAEAIDTKADAAQYDTSTRSSSWCCGDVIYQLVIDRAIFFDNVGIARELSFWLSNHSRNEYSGKNSLNSPQRLAC